MDPNDASADQSPASGSGQPQGLTRRSVLGAAAGAALPSAIRPRTARRRVSASGHASPSPSETASGRQSDRGSSSLQAPEAHRVVAPQDVDIVPLSQRHALKALGEELLVAADLALKGATIVRGPQQGEQGLFLGPDFDLGHARVRVVQTEHNTQAWAQFAHALGEAVKGADIVVPEYFPDEAKFSGWLTKRYVSQNGHLNAAFDGIAALCAGNDGRPGKDVWVLDPAHDGKFAKVGSAGPVLEGASFIAAALSLGDLVGSLASTGYPIGQLLFKRKYGLPLLEEYLDNDLRRVAVAQNLVDLCHSDAVPEGANIALIYPKGHWTPAHDRPGIEHYLQDAAAREQRLGLYKAVFGTKLFLPRHYPDGIVGDGLGYEPLAPRPPAARPTSVTKRTLAREAPRRGPSL